MNIEKNIIHFKRWKGNNNAYKCKCIKGGVQMVLELSNYKKNDPSIHIPFVDMLFDKEKRTAIYVKYDKNYQSTKEEDEIYNEMRGRYREED